MTHDAQTASKRYERSLLRGSFYNALGLIAKVINPAFFVVVTQLFGPVVMGVYVTATLIAEVVRSAVVGGYGDAVLIYASQALHEDTRTRAQAEQDFVRVVSQALRVSLGLSVVAAVAVYLVAGPLAARFFPTLPGLAQALTLGVCALPFVSLATIATAATKAKLHMQYEVIIMHLGQPFGLLFSAVAARLLGAGLPGLMLGYFVVQIVLALAGVWALARHTSLAAVARQLWQRTPSRQLHAFAIPQNLNLTLNRYLNRLDVIVLGILNFSAVDVAFYSTGALVAASLREVRIMFSSSLAPVAARHHVAGEREALGLLLSRITRWITTLAVPVVLVIAVFRTDILALVDDSYQGDSTFMLLLLLAAFVMCAWGLAGNCIVYMGHSGWNLFNSALVAVVTTGLNFLLIPRYGLMGAATATLIATTAVAVAQVVELRWLERLSVDLRAVYKPYVALLLALLITAFVGDPAEGTSLGQRVAIGLGMLAVYGLALWALRLEELAQLLAAWRRKRSS
jgi:O-antigen/teichoic acid export membrane protein